MTQRTPLYEQLLQETARIEWSELERFFARGVVIGVRGDVDLIEIAEAIANDDTGRVQDWLADGTVERMAAQTALDYGTRQPELWAVVVSPWVLVQERSRSGSSAPGAAYH